MHLSSLSPQYIKRYKDLLVLLLKYRKTAVGSDLDSEGMILAAEPEPQAQDPKAEELRKDLERLGPTYIKLGQFLSTRSDMLPHSYMKALAELQDRVQQFPYEEVEEIVSSELKVRISKAFLDFEQKPLAAASLAQVHRAVLHDGRLVAVKVQRPGIREQMALDLKAFKVIANVLDRYTAGGRRYRISATLDQFRRSTFRELDFLQEAQNLIILGRNLEKYESIIVPSPIKDYTTSRVLTMDYIRGRKITSVSPLRRLEIKGAELAEELFKAYLQQILVDGFYHADPHPGNVFLTDTGLIALLDLGMVGRLSESLQKGLLHLLVAISEGRGEETVAWAIKLGQTTDEFNRGEFRTRIIDVVGQYQHSSLGEIAVGRVILEVARIAGENGFIYPSELSMLGKTLLNLDNVGRTLDPVFDPNLSVRKNASELFSQKMEKTLSTGKLYEATSDTFEFLESLPKRVNEIIGSLADNQFKVILKAFDEKYLMTGFQKIANRLTAGMILASMIVGAAFLMPVQTAFTILDYPGLAIILFLLAAFGGVILLFKILFQDERMKKKEKTR